MAAWIDASLPISDDSVVWPGSAPLRVYPVMRISKGDMANQTRIEVSSHNTTHVDAPFHFDEGGKRIDELDVNIFVGPAWVVQVDSDDLIRADDLKVVPQDEFERVIFKTSNTQFLGKGPFRKDYVGIAPDAAQLLVDKGCKLTGIDYYSICPFNDVVTSHNILLSNGVAIVEALVLKRIEPGPVDFIALPLNITGSDGSPTRALIRPRS